PGGRGGAPYPALPAPFPAIAAPFEDSGSYSVNLSLAPAGVIRVPAHRPIPGAVPPPISSAIPAMPAAPSLGSLNFPWMESSRRFVKDRFTGKTPGRSGRAGSQQRMEGLIKNIKRNNNSNASKNKSKGGRWMLLSPALAASRKIALLTAWIARGAPGGGRAPLVSAALRRETAEEREAERQQASRLMLQLQHDAFQKSLNESIQPDPLCLHNSSLFALQNLQPWEEESTKIPPVTSLV
ncbi:TLX3 protein, partial [Hylia prasina]|nr:TLX3 protein [Hylia prasina]